MDTIGNKNHITKNLDDVPEAAAPDTIGNKNHITKNNCSDNLLTMIELCVTTLVNYYPIIKNESSKHIINGAIVIDGQSHTVEIDGEAVNLTPKEFELIDILAENRGNVFSREELLRKIWGYNFDGETRTVDVHIRKLRQKLGEYADIIETVKGIGYCIKGDTNE